MMQKLIDSDLRFKKLIENSFSGITLLDRHLNIVYRSPSTERINGWNTSERLKVNAIETIHPSHLQEVTDIIQEVLLTPGMSKTCVFKTLHFKGHYIWLECTYTNMLEEPDVEAIVCNFIDITAKKNADEALEQSVNELYAYKYALDESSIVAITDHRGIIKYVNENFCKISQYSSEELLGQDHRLINSKHHNKVFMKDLWHTIANGKTWKGELKNKAKDGTYYWVDTTIVPFLNDLGKPYQYIAIRSDITERKQSEERLTALNYNLQTQTRELMISNAELEQFAYVASHDLQEPLRMVTSFLTQLERKYNEIIDEKGKLYIHFAVDGAKRMRQIILDLLEFSRVGRTEDNLEMVDLNKLVKDILALYRKQIQEKQAIFHVEDLPPLLTFKPPIRQVFQNLISNGLKYSKPDIAPAIKIGYEENLMYWKFWVEDNGIGISKDYYDKIFIIFQRLHNKDEYSGTGMGLAVTKKIIESWGGKIWVESTEGNGSKFYFTIMKKEKA